MRGGSSRGTRGGVQIRPGGRARGEECPEGDPEGAKAEEGRALFLSWNIGGKPVETAVAATVHSTDQSCDKAIFAFQELPRVAAGWHTTHHDQRTLVQFRGEDQWRGNGIMFPARDFACLRRKANDIGVWLR